MVGHAGDGFSDSNWHRDHFKEEVGVGFTVVTAATALGYYAFRRHRSHAGDSATNLQGTDRLYETLPLYQKLIAASEEDLDSPIRQFQLAEAAILNKEQMGAEQLKALNRFAAAMAINKTLNRDTARDIVDSSKRLFDVATGHLKDHKLIESKHTRLRLRDGFRNEHSYEQTAKLAAAAAIALGHAEDEACPFPYLHQAMEALTRPDVAGTDSE